MRRKSVQKFAHRLVPIIITLAGLILIFLILPDTGLDARGRQFKGILPPREAKVKIPEPAAPPPTVIEEPEYPQISMIVNIPARKVTLYDENKEVLRHDIAVGTPGYKTPTGPMEIDTIIWNPWWIPPNSPWARGAKKQPPGPKNVLGPVKLLMGKGIRLHGTNADSSVGRPTSHGCLRMHNEEVKGLAWYIQKRINNSEDVLLNKYSKHRGTSFYVKLLSPVVVDIIYKPVEVRNDIIYIYKDIYGWAKDVKTEVLESLLQAGIDIKKIDSEKISKLKYPTGNGYVQQIKLKDLLHSRKKEDLACFEKEEEDN